MRLTRLVPSLKESIGGIPLIMHNANTNEEGQQYSLAFIGSDYVEQGRAVGQTMVANLPEGSRGVIISESPARPACRNASTVRRK
jgi:ABC-type sugar transport system substrate-binding protein